MIKYTPGPWMLDKVIGRDIISYPTDTEIASIWGNDAGGPIMKEEMQANAHLISAAPELLEALEVCQAVMNNQSSLCDGSFEATIDNACRVIAKAKGKTS